MSSRYDVSGLVGFTVVVIAVSSIAISLRFWSKLTLPNARTGWDDWLALASWPFALGICALTLEGARSGVGRHAAELSAEESTFLLKSLYAGSILFDLSISFSKISALAFYAHVFRIKDNPSRAWKWCFWIVFGLAVAWPIASVPYAIFQCSPVQKYWLPDTPGNCYGLFNAFISSASSSVIIDLLILILPLPQIFKLRLKRQRKLLVAGTFILGYGVAFMSVGRMITSAAAGDALITDFSYETIPTLYWIIAESGLSIFAICLPALFHLYKRAAESGIRSVFSGSSGGSSNRSRYALNRHSPKASGGAPGSSGANSHRQWHSRDGSDTSNTGRDPPRLPPIKQVAAVSTASLEKSSVDRLPMEVIHVRQDVRQEFNVAPLKEEHTGRLWV